MERNYDMYEWELLAIIKALDHWKAYLKMTVEPFTIITDHMNLTYWKSAQKLNCRTTRWHGELQDYNFTIEHTAGKEHTAADALSRPEGVDKGEQDNRDIIMLPTDVFVNKITTIMNKETRHSILQLYHDHPIASHPGRDETLQIVTKRYWWPNIRTKIKEYIKGCGIVMARVALINGLVCV
jgi:hypothetical protein